MGLAIRCIHSEEGCRWSGPLRHLQVSFSCAGRGTTPFLAGTHCLLCHQSHLNTCSFNVIPCPNRCPTKLSRRDLPAHLQHDCPKRRLKCEFCGCDFSGEAFEVSRGLAEGHGRAGRPPARGALTSASWASPQSHEGVCPQESVYCENKCGARMMRRLLAQHATSECPKRTQPCTYCAKEFVFDTIQVRPFPSGGRGAGGGGRGAQLLTAVSLPLRP